MGLKLYISVYLWGSFLKEISVCLVSYSREVVNLELRNGVVFGMEARRIIFFLGLGVVEICGEDWSGLDG